MRQIWTENELKNYRATQYFEIIKIEIVSYHMSFRFCQVFGQVEISLADKSL